MSSFTCTFLPIATMNELYYDKLFKAAQLSCSVLHEGFLDKCFLHSLIAFSELHRKPAGLLVCLHYQALTHNCNVIVYIFIRVTVGEMSQTLLAQRINGNISNKAESVIFTVDVKSYNLHSLTTRLYKEHHFILLTGGKSFESNCNKHRMFCIFEFN